MSILVTRPSPAGEELVSRLRTLGQVAWHSGDDVYYQRLGELSA